MVKKSNMVGYCGYRCYLCAARSDDEATRQKLVDGWARLFGLKNYTAKNVKCVGCKAEGKVADKKCQARPCARKRKVEFCAYCGDFPCDQLRPLIHPVFFATGEEYELCIAQFDIRDSLGKLMLDVGKQPAWLKKKRVRKNAKKRKKSR